MASYRYAFSNEYPRAKLQAAYGDETLSNPLDLPEVIVCAGPPTCNLQGDEAIEAADAGCPQCKHVVCHPDGSETEYQVRPI